MIALLSLAQLAACKNLDPHDHALVRILVDIEARITAAEKLAASVEALAVSDLEASLDALEPS